MSGKERHRPIVGTLGFVLSPDRERVLMVHRTYRKSDENLGKYNGVGGHLERGEGVAECMRREILEETGLRVTSMSLRGTICWSDFGPNKDEWLGFVFLVDGVEGEPFLCGDGFARIGEGSGTTDCLANAGVDEAWESGVMLAKSVLKLLQEGKEFTKENLEATYVADRRASALDKRLRKASGARNGFNKSFFWGMVGEGLRGMLGIALPFKSVPPATRVPELKDAVKGRIKDQAAFEAAVTEAEKARKPLHDAVMDACGWPAIPYDGELLVLHQDALLLGGKVQAAPGFADHVTFADPELCKTCTKHTCIEVCSAQALMPSDEPGGVPKFDREKCVHCGGCIWNCARLVPGTDHGNIVFKAGSGGLHSNEN